MLIFINTEKDLHDLIKAFGLSRPEKIVDLIADKPVIVSPEVAKLIMRAA